MNTTNGDFIEKTIPNTKNATLNINIGGVDSTMTVEKFANAIVIPPVLPSSTLKLDADISNTLQVVKDVTGNASSLQISTDTVRFTTPAAAPFKIKAKDISGAQFDLEAFLSNTSDEYLGLRMRGADSSYLSQLYYFRSTGTPDYLAIQVNLTDLMQFVNEGSTLETLIPSGKLGIGVARSTTINGTNIAPSAIMQVNSTTKGVLLPRMTTVEKNAISSPIAGLEVYDTTLNTKSFYNGSAWINVVVTPYKSYVALISQSGIDAPVATVLENTLGGAVVWSRSVTGQYVGTLTSAFTTGKTACFVTSKTANDYVSQYDYFLESSNTDDINLTSVSITGAEDGLLLDKIIEVRVYN
jgi:hypothetical protein